VIDSGLARRARYDKAAGTTQLVTERVSQAAATQRAGRAARQAPGIAYRLWEEAATAGLPRFDPPEILEADLSALTLDCAIWGVTDPAALGWLDPPPAAALAEARKRLCELDAVDDAGRPTDHGRALSKLPLPPRLAHMLIVASAMGLGTVASHLAVLLSERGLGGSDPDIDIRLSRWRNERGPRADAARKLALLWYSLVEASQAPSPAPAEHEVATCIALAFPDRIAKRRDASGEHWAATGGRGYRFDPVHPLARSEWLAVADVQGAAGGARITAAAAIDLAMVERLFASRIETGSTARFDPQTRRVDAITGRRLGAIILAQGRDMTLGAEAIAAALVEGVRTHGIGIIAWPEPAQRLRTRAAYAGIDAIGDAALIDRIEDWFPPLIAGKRGLDDIDPASLCHALAGLLDWDGRKALEDRAPAEFVSPADTRHAIDYAAHAGPTVTLRVQAMFGLDVHPVIGVARMPLILSLTSPAGRPIQTTRDLPGFWRSSWADVAKDMRGAYPKHNWPERPWEATASLKTKNALARG
jgi:ATP-dependent helicase HrpB